MLKLLSTQRTGRAAENIAKEYLKKQGLSFITSNFYCRYGEIDLIFKEQQILVFVEVRYRSKTTFGHAFETINQKKQNKILKTAEHYLYQNKLTESVSSRFDVIGIEPKDDTINHGKYKIDWIKNAFCY